MEYKKITSTDNEIIKKVFKILNSSSVAKKENKIILEGAHLVEEFFKRIGEESMNTVFISENFSDQLNHILEKVDKNKIIVVTEHVLKKISSTETPQGIVALCERNFRKVNKTELGFVIALEDVQDPGNVGTIIRTAASLGCDSVFLSKGCCDVWSSKVLRSGQGAHFYIDIYDNFDLKKLRDVFDGNMYATVLDEDSKSVYNLDLSSNTAFVLGNEGSGLSKEVVDYCDEKIYIPMQNNFESLNVAIAATVVISEKFRQNIL